MNKMRKQISKKTDVKTRSIYIGILIFVFSFVLYGQSINYGFTLDDSVVFVKHQTVNKGISGIPQLFCENSFKGYFGSDEVDKIYRPLTLSSFALQKAIFGVTPGISHFINVLLYSLLGISLFSFLRLTFNGWPDWLSGALVMLFIAHPIHTEVVCSIKSRDELMSVLFGILALNYMLRNITEKTRKLSLISGILLFMALCSKETAIMLVIVSPVLLYFKGTSEYRKTLKLISPLLLASVAFLVIRYFALYETSGSTEDLLIVNNVLNGAKSISDLIGTKLLILFYFVSKMVVPYPLSWDYSYNQIPITPLLSIIPILSIFIYVTLIVLFVYFFKSRAPLSFGIAFFLITSSITNNLFIKIGSTFGERFLFLPSIGFLIFVFGILLVLTKNNSAELMNKSSLKGGFVICLLIYCGITFARTPDWKNDFELYSSGVNASPKSSRVYSSLGGEYLKKYKASMIPAERKEYLDNAQSLFEKSVEILPDFFDAYYNLATIAYEKGDYKNAIVLNTKCISFAPKHRNSLHNLAFIYSNLNIPDSAIYYLDKINPNVIDYAQEYIVYSYAYAQKKDYRKSLEYAEKGIKASPKSPDSYKNMAAALYNLGDTSASVYYYNRYLELGGR